MISVQGRIQTTPGGPVTRADDTLGGGLLLVKDSRLLSSLDKSKTAALSALGITIATLSAEGPGKPVIDANGSYREWLDELDAMAVLVRPDFYVYGTASSTLTVQDLVDSFIQDTAYTARQRVMELSS
jgi:3-(3-hydroxy-phenyl)propionate hydroxylase